MAVRNPSFATGMTALQQQYNSLLNSLNGGLYGTQDYYAKQKQLGNLNAQMQAQAVQDGAQALSTQANAGGRNDARVEEYWNKALANTEGRGDAVMNDPYLASVMNRLQGAANGTDAPYTQQVQNQLITRQADANASGMEAQRQMIENQVTGLGGSMADPSAQAALRRLLAENQQRNNAAIGDMGTKATLANYGARNDAAMNLASARGGQLGMANSQYNQSANLYANRQLNDQHFDAVQQPAYGAYGSSGAVWGGGGSYTPFNGSPVGYTQTTSGQALSGGRTANPTIQRPATQSSAPSAAPAPAYNQPTAYTHTSGTGYQAPQPKPYIPPEQVAYYGQAVPKPAYAAMPSNQNLFQNYGGRF